MRHGGGSEGGESLLELIVAVAILGLGVVALLGGLTTAVFGSALNRSQADVSAVLTAASEQVKAATYMTCAVQATYLGSFTYPGWTGPAPVFGIDDWNGAFFVPRVAGASTCAQLENLGYRQQRVTLTVSSPNTRVSQTLTVVKRFRDCPVPGSSTSGCDG